MKNLSQILWGIVLVLAGIIWGLNGLGVTDIDIFFDGWWTLFIIVPSAISFFDPKKDGKVASLICMVVGVLLLLACLDLFDFNIVWAVFWPLVVVGIGLSLIFGKKNDEDKEDVKTFEEDEEDVEHVTVTFGEQVVNKANEKVKKMALNSIFGSLKIDLREADFSKETLIKASAIFGGIELIVPEDVTIKLKSTSILGGVDNERKNGEGKKVVHLETFAIFGGVEIK